MIVSLVEEAVQSGARREPACETIGVASRTVERWRRKGTDTEDARRGPKKAPANKLSHWERELLLRLANLPEYRDLSPNQIVPKLSDEGIYVASESTLYRVLHAEGQMAHRQASRPPAPKPHEYVATGPCQLLSWDITYLRGPVRGQFYYLYLFVDVWSRRVMGWAVHEEESTDKASELLRRICSEMGVDSTGIVLHSDNGSPMKGATMLATLKALGMLPSFSRPHVSDDNPYSESLFRTMKYRPWYPQKPFASLEQATRWVEKFVVWYNDEHLHSSIGFVTPTDRHHGADIQILEERRQIYAASRKKNPNRWSGQTRSWNRPTTVTLNPERTVRITQDVRNAAA